MGDSTSRDSSCVARGGVFGAPRVGVVAARRVRLRLRASLFGSSSRVGVDDSGREVGKAAREGEMRLV